MRSAVRTSFRSGVLLLGILAATGTAFAGPPPATTLSSPSGNITQVFPGFSWLSVPSASWYQVWISRNGQTYHSEWRRGKPVWIPPANKPLPPGKYTWWVRTWNPDGLGPWSGGLDFTVVLPAPVNPEAIVETIGSSSVHLTWTGDPHATWTHIYLTRNNSAYFDRWHTLFGYASADDWSTWAGEHGSTNHDFDWWEAWLPEGTYKWYVQEWRDGHGASSWTSPRSFTVLPPEDAPAEVKDVTVDTSFPYAPVGFGYGYGISPRPEFRWDASNVPWYQIRLTKGGVDYLTEWTRYARWRPRNDVPSGTYSATVRGWNSRGLGAWSSPCNVPLNYSAPAAVDTLSAYGYGYAAFAGMDDFVPYAGWTLGDSTFWYQAFVTRNGATFRDGWFDISNPPAGVRVELDRQVYLGSGGTLPTGSYKCWVRGWNPQGFSPWSSAANFTLDPMVAPAIVSPAGVGGLRPVTGLRPVIEWTEVAGADAHVLLIRRGDGSVYHREIVEGTVWTADWNFAAGTYSVTVQGVRALGAETGPWSTTRPFTAQLLLL